MYVLTQNITTDINGTNLNFTLGNTDPKVVSNTPGMPPMMQHGQNYAFNIQNPSNTDIATFVFGDMVTLSIVAANTAA